MDEGEYQEFLQSFPFGNKYLVPRKDLITRVSEKDRPFKKEFQAGAKKQEKVSPQPSAPKVEEAAHESPGASAIDREGPLPPADEIQEKPGRGETKDEGELSIEERLFLEFVSQHPGMFVTNMYKALELSGYKGDKLKESLIEKGLITQEETRTGKGGRLAKILTVTDKGAFILKKSARGGKGGDLHKYLQMTIKERAELYGWKAKIEEKIPGSLETVDVGLSKQDVKVAVEISSTSRAGQEMQNIRKCLEAGYDYVICVCAEGKRLSAIKTEAKKGFTLRERERIRFCLPGGIKDFLQGTGPAAIVSENEVVSGQIAKQKHLLNTIEAAEYLGISKNTLYEWIVQRKIPYVKVGRLVKFRREDLETWLKGRTQQEERIVL
jgi:excisionase family DNA binding protein